MTGHIVPRIPPHTVYCEPFAGGAAVLFAKPVSHTEVLNDRDGRLVNLYRVARQQPEEFYRWVESTPYSRQEYYDAAAILQNPEGKSDLELAWAYYVQVEQSFSHCIGNGWRIARCNRTSTAREWCNRLQRLPDAMLRLREVNIEHLNAIACIEKWDTPHTFFYVDPPYPGSEQGHYAGYTLDDWRSLCQYLDGIAGKYILSGYEQPIEPESALQKISIPTVCSASDRRDAARDRRTEILWANFPPQQRQIELFTVRQRHANSAIFA